MMSFPHVNVIVCDEFTEQASHQYDIDDNSIEIKFDGDDFNFNLDLQKIEETLDHEIHPAIIDLYRIASAVYFSDLQLSRPKARTRNFDILISVSEKSRWDAQKQHLESMLRFLSGDSFNFHFVQGRFPDQEFLFTDSRQRRAVSLFSGGLDSFSGVKWLIDHEYSPMIISHGPSNNIITSVQNTLHDELQRIIENLEIIQVKARPRRNKDNKAKELSQRTRSFLFLSLGSIFALENGIREIFLSENGILALNIPITQSRIFSNTKTAHPKFINNFNVLINNLFPNSISVINPFDHMTKGETISFLDNDENYINLIRETVTCSRSFRLQITPNITAKNCGICIPCILRRASIHHANFWDYDVQYAYDILDYPDENRRDDLTALMELLAFLRTLEKSNPEILIDNPDFYLEEFDPDDAIDLARRYGNELKEMIRDKGSDTLISNLSEWL